MRCPHCSRPISSRFVERWAQIIDCMKDGRELDRIHKVIVGAIKQAIDAHGPITRTMITSAAKRVHTNLKNYAKQVTDDEQRRQGTSQ